MTDISHLHLLQENLLFKKRLNEVLISNQMIDEKASFEAKRAQINQEIIDELRYVITVLTLEIKALKDKK